jgi:uncharacterized protein
VQKFIDSGFGRTIFIKLDRGEKLLETIQSVIVGEKIKNAVVLSAVGTLERASFHRVKNCAEIPEEEMILLDGAFELSSLQGLVLDGAPHLHMTITDHDRTYAAHLEPGSIVLYVAEILLAEIKGFENVKRIIDEYGIPRIITS